MGSRALQVLRSAPVKGAIAGVCATAVLDAVSTLMYENEDLRVRVSEDAARGGLHAYERAVTNIAHAFGVHLSRRQTKAWGWRFHKAFGVAGGIKFAILRERAPQLGRAFGLPFGSLFYAIGDELLMPLLRLTPGPRRFSWKVHARGAIAHVLYGVVAEVTLRLIERATSTVEAPALEKTNGAIGRLASETPELVPAARLA